MIGNGDQLFSDSKLKMMSEIYVGNSWVQIIGCGRGRAVKGSMSEKPQIAARGSIPLAVGFFLLCLLTLFFFVFFLNKSRGF